MLVAVSGAQGSGKSTVLSQIAQLGFNVIERKSARTVMAEEFPGMTLDDIYADSDTAVQWQEAIIQLKYLDEREAIDDTRLWFTERTYADLFTYAVMAVGKNNKHSNWLNKYYADCRHHAQKYLHSFYIEGGHFKPVDDGVRGMNEHYQNMIDTTMLRVTKDMLGEKMTTINVSEISDRVRWVLTSSMNFFTINHVNTT